MVHFHFGKRLFKTAVAVFITAQICYMLNWPMIFAVISAMVTIEPTVDASIRKGIVRFPAAAIGAAFAMIFDALLGTRPITFTLSALSTIYVCNLFRWNHAIVVSTLTAVNMIHVSEANYVLEFVIRLGTTVTGIVVSAAVNYLLFRPEYLSELKTMLSDTRPKILARARQVLDKEAKDVPALPFAASLDKMQTLLNDHIADIRYRRTAFAELREIAEIRQTLQNLRRILFYMETAVNSRDEHERTQCYRLLEGAVRKS